MFCNIYSNLICIVPLCNYFCISSMKFLQDMFQKTFIFLCIVGKCSSVKISNQMYLQLSYQQKD